MRNLENNRGTRFTARWMSVLGIAGAVFLQVGNAPSLDAQERKISSQDLQFFESKIRPVLVDKCYSCHSLEANSAEGGLRLDSAEAIARGGSGGPAIVSGEPSVSLLIRAIEYNDPEFAMPPADAGGKLSPDQIRDLTRWVRMGAPDPRKDPEMASSESSKHQAGKDWWAFQPIRSVAPPAPTSDWSWNEIDRFIEVKHREKGLSPTKDAPPEVLLRRLYFDLTGLPPTLEQQKAFLKDLQSGTERKVAISKVVDTLLDTKAFGEHWGRHWLDVARYAESTGRDINLPYNNAWRYRDWVIQAFEKNMPFDEFLVAQIAGDQLPNSNPKEKANNLIATGFLAVGSKSVNEQNPKQFAVDMADEQIDAVFQSSMALTVACSRCHDHKFDPISQKEYTAIAGIFLSTETHFGVTGGPQSRNATKPLDLPKGHGQPIVREAKPKAELQKERERLASMKKEVEESVKERFRDRTRGKEPANNVDQQKLRRLGIEIAQLDFQLNEYNDDGSPKAQAMAVTDRGRTDSTSRDDRSRFVRFMANRGGGAAFTKIDDSPFFARGDIDLPGNKVKRGMIQLFGDESQFTIPADRSGRLELARWIVSDNNPMTARVAVNRLWQWTIGQGIVTSVDNFGTTGATPSHPELLDYLATEFKKDNWNVKNLIRQIVTSRTYQLSSILESAHKENEVIDSENAYCWRAKSRRLQAEEIRDAMLVTANLLDSTPPVGTSLAKAGMQRLDGRPGRRRGRGEVLPDDVCRSIYLPLPRSAAPEMLELFDLPDAAAVQGVREATNVPTQALFLLNNPAVGGMAGNVLKSVAKIHPGRTADKFEERLETIYQLLLSRKPTSEEERFARKLFIQSGPPEAGWMSIVRGLYATAEFRYLD